MSDRIKEGLARGDYYVKNGQVVCSTCGSNCGQCADSKVPGPVPEGWEHYTSPDRARGTAGNGFMSDENYRLWIAGRTETLSTAVERCSTAEGLDNPDMRHNLFALAAASLVAQALGPVRLSGGSTISEGTEATNDPIRSLHPVVFDDIGNAIAYVVEHDYPRTSKKSPLNLPRVGPVIDSTPIGKRAKRRKNRELYGSEKRLHR